MAKDDRYNQLFAEKMKSSSKDDIFKNRNVLNTHYIPPTLLFREKETEYLQEKIVSSVYNPNHIGITGVCGSGKTCTVKFLFRIIEETKGEIEQKIAHIYVDCMEYKNFSQIMVCIIKQIDSNILLPLRHNRSFYMDIFKSRITTFDSVIVCLDEADKLITRQGHQEELIWNLSNLRNVSLIMISNKPRWYTGLDPRIKSRLTTEHICFEPYSIQECYDILKERITIGLKEGTFQEDCIIYLAKYTSISAGDIRLGLNILKTSCDILSSEKRKTMDTDTIERAKKTVEMLKIQEQFTKLPLYHRFLLLAIAQLCIQFNSDHTTSTHAFERYREEISRDKRYCEGSEKSDDQLHNYLREFKLYDLITTQKKGRGRGKGIETIITPLFDVQKLVEMFTKKG